MEAEPAAAEAAPDGRSAAPASPSAEPGAAAAQPDGVARPAEFAARPAERAWQTLLRIWAAAVAAKPPLAFAPFPERPALFQEPVPNRQISADPRRMPARSFPALSNRRLFPGDCGPPQPEPSPAAE